MEAPKSEQRTGGSSKAPEGKAGFLPVALFILVLGPPMLLMAVTSVCGLIRHVPSAPVMWMIQSRVSGQERRLLAWDHLVFFCFHLELWEGKL